LYEPIIQDINGMEKKLKELTNMGEDALNTNLMNYLNGGKRLRSAIVLIIGEMFGSKMEPFYTLAASIEMLHSTTLAHDDLIDEDTTRRKQVSAPIPLPQTYNILIGDYLLAQSTSVIASLENSELMKIYSQTLVNICRGEYHQWSMSGQVLNREVYYDIIQKKTAHCFPVQ
jgi:geranylgeranyl pyrophosphate synthase